MEENKNNLPVDEERKTAIKMTMGCTTVIFVVMAGIAIALIVLYLQSIFTGGKEFLIQ